MLRRDMERLVEELHEAIPAAFESEHYRNSVAEIDQELEDRHRSALDALQQEARRENVSLMRTPQGFALAPIWNGELLSDAAFEKLPSSEQERIKQAMSAVSEKLRQHIEKLPEWQKERRERLKKLNREITESVAGPAIAELEAKYAELPDVLRH